MMKCLGLRLGSAVHEVWISRSLKFVLQRLLSRS